MKANSKIVYRKHGRTKHEKDMAKMSNIVRFMLKLNMFGN